MLHYRSLVQQTWFGGTVPFRGECRHRLKGDSIAMMRVVEPAVARAGRSAAGKRSMVGRKHSRFFDSVTVDLC
jgi:hypothetical protein